MSKKNQRHKRNKKNRKRALQEEEDHDEQRSSNPRPSQNDKEGGDRLVEPDQEQEVSSFTPWKKVEVGLPEAVLPGNHYDDDDDDDEEDDGNKDRHDYAATNRGKRAKQDLEASAGEEMGIFFGLEVIAPEDYHVEVDSTTGVKRFQLLVPKKKNSESSDSKSKLSKGETATTSASNNASKDHKKKTKADTKTATMKKDATHQAVADDGGVQDLDDKADGDKEDVEEKVEGEEEEEEEEVQKMQLSWLTATGGVELHVLLCRALVRLGFWTPTPIQSATLPVSILGHACNVVGAAPTGSGKTLAFLLPIGQDLLERGIHNYRFNKNNHHEDDGDGDDDDKNKQMKNALSALILTPTRELALQIQHACDSLFSGSCKSRDSEKKHNHQQQEREKTDKRQGQRPLLSSVAVVGGLAVAKQTRLLQRQPPIVIATPGRLWDLISKQSHPHLRDLSQIRHLVVDEADRMIQQGSFPELTRILEAIHVANPMMTETTRAQQKQDDEESLDDDDDRLSGLPGVPGEAKVEMLSDRILQQIEQQRQDGAAVHEPLQASSDESDGDDGDDEHEDEEHDDHDDDSGDDEHNNNNEQDGDGDVSVQEEDEDEEEADHDRQTTSTSTPVLRRTYIFSATLTLPASSSSFKKRDRHVNVDGAIAEILDKARSKGRTKIIDLTNGSIRGNATKESRNTARLSSQKASTMPNATISLVTNKGNGDDSFRLPPGLSLHQIQCTQKHKDSHLYAYLMTTKQGSSGPCLVFCNSIVAVRRVGATLQALGLDVRILHAQMQQRARLKAVESLQKSCLSVVVATDVAARGLDIPSVASVVHYDVPRTVDMFIHRSGRTARGVGEGATGSSLSLIAPGDDKNYARISKTLQLRFQPFPLDGRLLRAAQERVNLACKVVAEEDGERKCKRDRKWFHDQAAEAGLEIDDALIEDDNDKSLNKQREARRAKAQLSKLLAQPMQTQRYGKFLSTNSAVSQLRTAAPSTKVEQQPRKRQKQR